MAWLSKVLARATGNEPWSWTPLRADHLADAFFTGGAARGHFAFDVKRIFPDINIDFPTERRRTIKTNYSVKIHGAAYFFDLEKRSVSVLPVRAHVGDALDDPGGHLSVSTKNTSSGWEAYCSVAIGVPDARTFGASLIDMLGACNQPSSRFVRTRRHLRFVCSLTNAQDKARLDRLTAGDTFEWPARDVQASIEDDGGDQFGGWDFVSRDDYGLLDDSRWVNRLCRLHSRPTR